MINWFKKLPGRISGFFSDIWETFKKLPDKLGESAERAGDRMLDALKRKWESVKSMFLKGVTLGFSGGGDVTERATGGITKIGETTLVGENGPELVQMPAGTNVMTSSETQKAMGGVTINFGDVSVRNDQDIQTMVDMIAESLGNKSQQESLGLTT